MTARPQFQTLLVAGQVPSALRPNRELWLNMPDRMLGTTDGGAAIPLLGVRVYSPTASYGTNAMVAKNGQILVARAAIVPGAFNPAQWTPLGGNATLPPDASPGSLYIDGANTVLSAGLAGAVAWNAYRTAAGAWKTRETGISAYMALDPAHGLRVYSASSAAAGATPTFTPLIDFSSPTQVDLPQGKLSLTLAGAPALALFDSATSTRMGVTQQDGLLTLGVLDAASVLTQAVTSFRQADRALIHSGSVYLAAADAVLYLHPSNAFEWRSYVQAGDHIIQHRPNHYDRWRSSDGQRAWVANGAFAMTLTPPGDLWLAGTSVQIAGGASGLFYNAGSTDLKLTTDNWHLGLDHTTGTLGFFNAAGTDLFHVDASGSIRVANAIAAVGLATVGSMNVVGHTQTISAHVLDWLTVGGLFTANGALNVSGNLQAQTLVVVANATVSGDVFTQNVHADFNVNAGATVSGHDVTAVNIVSAANVFASVQGYKPGGGSWVDTSDVRSKTELGGYMAGLDELIMLRPVRYVKRAGVTLNGVPSTDSDREFVGLIAQEAEVHMPEMFTQVSATINGAPVTDLRIYDSNALVYALINAVKELHDRVAELEENAV